MNCIPGPVNTPYFHTLISNELSVFTQVPASHLYVPAVNMSDPFPDIKSKHSLVAKYVTEPIWEKLSKAKTKTSGETNVLFELI